MKRAFKEGAVVFYSENLFDFFNFAVKILLDFAFLQRFVILCVYPERRRKVLENFFDFVVKFLISHLISGSPAIPGIHPR
jgi:hypothetical protein